MKRALALLAACTVALVASTSAQSPRVALSGRVVSATTDRPIPGARVSTSQADMGFSATANADGQFQLDLSKHRWIIRASAPGYAPYVHGDEPGLGPTPISTESGQPGRDLEIRLQRGATITGRAIDDRRDPIVSARVLALSQSWQHGSVRYVATAGADAQTDDRGEFRLIGLRAGEYVIALVDRGVTTFAPAAATLKTAQRVTVGVAEEKTGVNIQATPVGAGSIEGGFGAIRGSTVKLVPDQEVPLTSRTATVQRDGRFRFDDVAAGRHWLVVQPGSEGRSGAAGQAHFWAREAVIVQPDRTTTPTITLREGVTISGRVSSALASSAGRQVLNRGISISPIGVDHPEAAPKTMVVDADGSFRVPGVAPGRYRWLRTQEASFLFSVFLKDMDITDAPLVVTVGVPVDGLRAVFTDHGSIRGRVTDRAGNPTTAGGVIVASTDRRHWTGVSRRLTVVRADASGEFEAPRLPAGDYLVAHVDRLTPGQLWDTAFLRSLVPAAKVSVAAGRVETVQLRLK